MFHERYTPHFVYPSFDGNLSCFHLLATVNNDAMNTGMQTSGSLLSVLLSILPRSGIAMFNFFRTIIQFSVLAAPFYILTSNVQGS